MINSPILPKLYSIMHAYIVTGSDAEKADREIKKLILKLNGKPIEFSIAKIEQVRELNKYLSYSHSENTLIIVKNADLATTEALNAFLKNLEEPQKNVKFILSAVSEYSLPPTVISRCQVIRTYNPETIKTNKISVEFMNSTVGGKLLTIEKIRKREEAVLFLKNLIQTLHTLLIEAKDGFSDFAESLKYCQNTLDAVNQNGNVTIQLTNLVINLSKLKFSLDPKG